MKLPARTAVITGGAKGIGLAVAERLGRDGAHIALLDMNPADLEAAGRRLGDAGITVRTYVTDVSDEAEVIRAMDGVVADFGRLDVLVNNAGILRDALLVKVKDGQVVDRMSLA